MRVSPFSIENPTAQVFTSPLLTLYPTNGTPFTFYREFACLKNYSQAFLIHFMEYHKNFN